MESVKAPDEAREAKLCRMMRAYGGMLVGLCTAMLGDAQLAQDVTQETFIKAYYKMDALRAKSDGSEKAWLARIAVNLCRDQRRAKWSRYVDRHVTPEMLPDAANEVNDEDKRLFAAVQALSGKYREVVLLRYYQDLDVSEIAGALALSPSSVYRRLEKAQQRLKKTLERWDLDEG